MKAVVVTDFGSADVLEFKEVERPVPGPNQVLIRVEATSVNFADIKARYGQKDGKRPPFIPGLDCTGVISELGSGVTSLQVGQRVIAFPSAGSYAEYTVASTDLTFPIPDLIDIETAAACPIVSFTSHMLLADVAKLVPGESVLVHAAAGGIGTTAIQLAKLLGAGKIIGTVSHKDKVEAALSAGADTVIDTSTEDFAKTVLELTQGKGVDIILDSISGKTTEQSLLALAMYGRLVQFGNASGETANIQTKDLHSGCRSVLGFSFGTTRKHRTYLVPRTAEKVLNYLADGRLKIKIQQRFALEDAAAAQLLVESRKSQGKILLLPPPSSISHDK